MTGKKTYIASDFHLGLKAGTEPAAREKKVVAWLNGVAPDAGEIYLLGDVFDFWWEYKKVVPKGFTRFLGTISALTDAGLSVYMFPGNHDMWIGQYLEDECGVEIFREPVVRNLNGKKFYLAHGEGLGSGDAGYRVLLWLFRNRTIQRFYSMLHPAFGVAVGHRWSMNSRLGKGISLPFMGEEKEDLFRHSKSLLEKEDIDYFVYGHRHLPLRYCLPGGQVIVILGDWIESPGYAVWDGIDLRLEEYR